METIFAILFFALAVWYLYRRFNGIMNPEQPTCGCSGCGSCSKENLNQEKNG